MKAKSSDSYSGVTKYSISFGLPKGGDVLHQEVINSSENEITFSIPNVDLSTLYFASVRVDDACGNFGDKEKAMGRYYLVKDGRLQDSELKWCGSYEPGGTTDENLFRFSCSPYWSGYAFGGFYVGNIPGCPKSAIIDVERGSCSHGRNGATYYFFALDRLQVGSNDFPYGTWLMAGTYSITSKTSYQIDLSTRAKVDYVGFYTQLSGDYGYNSMTLDYKNLYLEY